MTQSETLFERARHVIPGGVNSPVRAFNGVGGTPLFIHSAEGPLIKDEDGREYIDYVGSWGPMILGHNHPDVRAAVIEAAHRGLSFGAPTAAEVEMAATITSLIPSIEQVRMVNSGTEATMSALRLARGYTGRDKIIKFEGCYHGHADSLLVKAGSGALTLGQPNSPGVPKAFAEHTLTAQFNDLNSVADLFKAHSNQIAAIIVEPVAGNMNCIAPMVGFLEGLRDLCDENGTVLIFDEVMTGFRIALGGAQAHYSIKPDLTCLGKIVGGGMPVGAFGGRADIMDHLAPVGGVYQAGTLSGNPVAMAAGLATLKAIQEPGFYDTLSANTHTLVSGMKAAAQKHSIELATENVGGMFGLFFTGQEKVTTHSQSAACNIQRFQAFFHHMLDLGVYLAPSAYEAGFVSIAHSAEHITQTIACADEAFAKLR